MSPMPAGAAQLFVLPHMVGLHALDDSSCLTLSVASHGGALPLLVQRQSAHRCEQIMLLPTLSAMWVRQQGRYCAIVGPANVTVLDLHAHGRQWALPLGGVAAASFGPDDSLWLLRGQGLYRLAAGQASLTLVSRQVVAFGATAELCVRAEREEGEHVRMRVQQQDSERMVPGGVAIAPGCQVDLCIAGAIAYLMVQPRLHDGRAGSVIHRCDLRAGRWLASVALAPLCHTGMRRQRLQPWRDGAALLLDEPGEVVALCVLEPDAEAPRVLSPAGLEVLDFRAEASSSTIALLGIETAPPRHARSLLIGGTDASGAWVTRSRYERVGSAFDLRDGRTFFSRAHPDGVELCSARAGRLLRLRRARAPRAHGLPVVDGADPRAPMPWAPPHVPRPLLAFLPGWHKLPTTSLQANFLQEFVVRLLASLEERGFEVCILQLPGSAGRGRIYRGGADIHELDAMARDIAAAVAAQAGAARRPMGLISTSLGAPGLLRALGRIDAGPSCALIAPVYSPQVLGGTLPFTDPGLLETGACEVLVVHGDRDEVSPYQHSLAFAGRPPAGRRRLLTLEGEGHIFAHGAAWQRTADAIRDFFVATLLPAPGREGV